MNLTVRQLIEQLSKLNPDREVYIQQGGEMDYMAVYSVLEKELLDFEKDELEMVVALEFG